MTTGVMRFVCSSCNRCKPPVWLTIPSLALTKSQMEIRWENSSAVTVLTLCPSQGSLTFHQGYFLSEEDGFSSAKEVKVALDPRREL